MTVIGVVGGMGSGKSTVARLIGKTVKAHIISADHVGHMILKKGCLGYDPVIKHFGKEIVGLNEEINRKTLGRIVFSDAKELQALNKISHPLIYQYIKEEIQDKQEQGIYPYIVIDAALLIEIGLTALVDQVWGVYVPQKIQIQRVMLRNGFSKQEALKRISSQLSWDEIRKTSDIEIDNSNTIMDTKEQILLALKQS